MFEILADDQARVLEFYAAVFGWEYSFDPVGYAYVHFPPATRHLLGGIGTAKAGVPGWQKGTAFYLEVPDLRATLDLVVEYGGQVVVQPTEADAYHFALFTDTESNLVGIIQRFDG
jgi:predicted enzyme related to lactoylglutathione lyase